MLILSNRVRVLRHYLHHSTQTLSINPMTRLCVFKSLFFATEKFIGNNCFHKNLKKIGTILLSATQRFIWVNKLGGGVYRHFNFRCHVFVMKCPIWFLQKYLSHNSSPTFELNNRFHFIVAQFSLLHLYTESFANFLNDH